MELVNKVLKDLWNRIRRNPEYLNLCKRVQFDEKKDFSLEKTKDSFNSLDEIVEILNSTEPFGLKSFIHPDQEFEEITLGETYPFLIFEDYNLTVTPKFQKGQNGLFIPLERDKIASFEIDISRTDNEIITSLLRWIRTMRKAKAIAPKRDTFEKREKYYQIWDDRKERKDFSIISKEHGISIDTAKKRFYRAYELIIGKPYDGEYFKKEIISKRKQTKLCTTCPIYDTCNDPCPNVLEYIDQDQGGGKEFLRANYHLLYSEDDKED